MDKRTKILAGLFGAVVTYALLAGVVYPRWFKPLLTLKERIAERKKDLDKLLKEDAAVQAARLEYKQWAGRIGAFDPGRVDTDIRDRLNQLIEKHKLADASVTPSRPVEDRKTGMFTSSITVTATGALDAAITFLKDVSEMPHLTRVANASLSPVGGRRGLEKDQRVSLRLPLETWVIPQQRVVGPLAATDLAHPETFVRHLSLKYREISEKKPFWDWVPPVPLVVRITRPINVEINQPATLEGVVSGGDGQYAITWSPTEGLSDATSLRPTVDTSKVGNRSYTLSVTDGTSNTVTSSTTVVVREPPPKVEPQVAVKPQQPPPPPPPVKPTRKRWPDGRSKEIKMALLCSYGGDRSDEFMVYNTRSKQNEYYKVGDEFDGGTLEYVHQYGGVVRWENEYYIYPLGVSIDQGLDIASAEEHPELLRMAEAIKARRTPAAKESSEEPTSKAAPTAVETQEGTAAKPEASEPARKEFAPQIQDLIDRSVAVPRAPEAGSHEVQLAPLVYAPPESGGDGVMGPPGPEQNAAQNKVRSRPKPPNRPVVRPKP